MTNHHDTIKQHHIKIQRHVDAIAEYFKTTQADKIQLQSSFGDAVISAESGNILDGLQHKHTFALYPSRGIKQCVDCPYNEPLEGLKIEHQRG